MPGDDKRERPIGVRFQTGDDGRWVSGQLTLKEGDLFDANVVHIFDEEFFHIDDGGDLHGISEAGKVSLLDCVHGGMLATTSWDDFSMHHGDVAFRCALFGKEHVSGTDKTIRSIEFVLEGAARSVFMHDKHQSFGFIHDPDDRIMDAIESAQPDYLRGRTFVRGDSSRGKGMVSYFTGDWDFLSEFETVLGSVHVGRYMTTNLYGTRMEDTPVVAIDFEDEPTTLEGAWEKVREVRQFFTWMMGYAPAWKNVRVFTSKRGEDGHRRNALNQLDDGVEVFGPKEWRDVPREAAQQFGTLIDASRHPEHFKAVMAKWLERNSDGRRKSANTRFFTSFIGTIELPIEEKIVSAGNMFDLLPSEDKPPVTPLPDAVLDVLDAAKKGAKAAMVDHPDKDEMLSALNHIRANKFLRDIVLHRAKEVTKRFGEDKLANLEEMIRWAVRCRNHYTHGPNDQYTKRIDFTDYTVVGRLVETLEFVYGASELLLCGWKPTTSVRAEYQPLGGFVKFYDPDYVRVLGLK